MSRSHSAHLVLFLLLPSTLISGCTNPDLDGNAWVCETADDCGAGWTCRAGVCQPEGAPDDADASGATRDGAGPGEDTGGGPAPVAEPDVAGTVRDAGGPSALRDAADTASDAGDALPDGGDAGGTTAVRDAADDPADVGDAPGDAGGPPAGPDATVPPADAGDAPSDARDVGATPGVPDAGDPLSDAGGPLAGPDAGDTLSGPADTLSDVADAPSGPDDAGDTPAGPDDAGDTPAGPDAADALSDAPSGPDDAPSGPDDAGGPPAVPDTGDTPTDPADTLSDPGDAPSDPDDAGETPGPWDAVADVDAPADVVPVCACDDGDRCTEDSCDPAGACRHDPVPDVTAEDCDGVDDDCDGRTDEGCTAVGDPCTVDEDCASGPCRRDIDGDGWFCAAGATDCVLARQGTTATSYADGDVYCLGPTWHRICDEGTWSPAAACDDGIACTVDTCRTGPGCAVELDDAVCADHGACGGVCDPLAGCVDRYERCDCAALAFEGFERVAADGLPTLLDGPERALTVEAWLRIDPGAPPDAPFPIVSRLDPASSAGWALYARGGDLVVRFHEGETGDAREETAPGVLGEGWNHVGVSLATAPTSTLILWADGRPALTTGLATGVVETGAPLSVGPTPALPGVDHSYAVDEVRLWTAVRTEAELHADFDRPLTGAEAGLLAYWPFGDVTSALAPGAVDLTANGWLLAFRPGARLPATTTPREIVPSCADNDADQGLLLSRYVNSEGDDKWFLEIFNTGAARADLEGFAIHVYNDGAALPTSAALVPPRSVDPGQSVTLCVELAASQTGNEPCDGFLALRFDGADSVALAVDDAWIDVFGQVGVWYPDGWGESGTFTDTMDNRLQRRCEVRRGRADGTGPFDVGAEWFSIYDPSSGAEATLYGLHCGHCGGVRCPPADGLVRGCTERDHCTFDPPAPAPGVDGGTIVFVPPSRSSMGSETPPSEGPVHFVTFAEGFGVDQREVTAAAFVGFLADTGGTACVFDGAPVDCVDATASGATVSWDGLSAAVADGCRDSRGTLGSCAGHPATGVTWYGGRAFCDWIGARLCSESEWERAARGVDGRTWPWGETPPDASHANCAESDCADGFTGTAPVDALVPGLSAVGARNMAGNVAEWVEDDWHGDYDRSDDGACDAPMDGAAWVDAPRGALRSLRGGGYTDAAADLRAARRRYALPASGAADVGFRCCHDAP